MNINKKVIAIFIILSIIFSIYVIFYYLNETGGSNDDPWVTARWDEVTNISETEGKLIIGKVLEPRAFRISDIKFDVYINGTETGYIDWNWTNSDIQSITWKNLPSGVVVTFIDNNEQNVLDEGDVIILSGLKPDTTYEFEYFHYPSDGDMHMTGNNSFTTPP